MNTETLGNVAGLLSILGSIGMLTGALLSTPSGLAVAVAGILVLVLALAVTVVYATRVLWELFADVELAEPTDASTR